jgi:cytochrome c oxidase assembly protein subunit 15
MDEALGLCRGCGRSADEIAEWSSAGDSRRKAIWAALPERIDALGILITRLPWRYGRITDFVAESFYQRSGTWVIGCHGASAEFMCRHDELRDISVSGDGISAISERGGLQLTIDDKVRALQLRAGPKKGDFRAIFLVVLKARAVLPVATALTPLGCDEGAVQPKCRNEHQFDLGLGRADLRFCLRTATAELRERLNHASGLALCDLAQAVGSMILTHSSTRVVESPIGRVEIFPSSAESQGRSREGPRSFLALEKLTSGRSTPPGIDLPPVYALGATFYPHMLGAGTDISSRCHCSRKTIMGKLVVHPSSARAAKGGMQIAHRTVAIWLWIVAALVFLMVVVGGATRLTESGLSITEWKPLTGVLPPLSQAEWLAEFENYKRVPQYAELFPDMDLRGFKFIFFFEWAHRLLGRLIGAVMAVPLIFFWAKGFLPPGFKPKLLGILVLGGLQGFVGWWMVKSGLSDRVEVAQERLAIHLLLASVTFAALVWVASSLNRGPAEIAAIKIRGLKWFAAATVLLVLVQIGLGGLVAGLRAGRAFNTWPLIDGHFLPPLVKLTVLAPGWRNFLDNILLVQFQHRMIAYALLALTLVQALYAWREAPKSRAQKRAFAIAGLAAMQVAIGIVTLVLAVPLWAGILHQAFAMIVLGMAVSQGLSQA